MAAHWPKLVHGVVAEAAAGAFVNGDLPGHCPTTGTDGLLAAWTLNGKPIPNNSPIPVDRIAGPVLVVSGGADWVWPSELQADQIMAALPHNGVPHVHLNYPVHQGRRYTGCLLNHPKTKDRPWTLRSGQT